MRRQISRAIIGVALLLVLVLGLPLALVVQRFYQDRAIVDLQRRAAETVAEIALPISRSTLAAAARERDAPGAFTVYDRDGHRVFGTGPVVPDAVVRRALQGRSASHRGGTELVVATPLTERTDETVVAAVRVSEATSTVDAEIRRVWAAMALVVVAALVGAALLARVQGRRLAEPVVRLARQAEALGRGEISPTPPPSGVLEVDTVADALAASGVSFAELLARERAFSADVAHQLRTPLTGLRLTLDRLAAQPGAPTEITALGAEVTRLEATVEQLLALARGRQPVAGSVHVARLLEDVAARWTDRFARAGRDLDVAVGRDARARGSAVALSQVLDVLVDNALHHGAGRVTVRSRHAPGGVVVEVADEGDGLEGLDELEEPTGPRPDTGHGIGLALARRLVESGGGRLLLASTRPPSFHLVLPLERDEPTA